VKVTYCMDSFTNPILTSPIYAESAILSIILLFIAIRNSSIKDPRYSEEGKSILRYAATSAILVVTKWVVYFVFLLLMPSQNSILEQFWIVTIYCTVTPVLLYIAILSPKVILQSSPDYDYFYTHN